MAAVRETFEETGLFLGAPGDVGETHNESWNQVRALGLAPDLAKLEYVGHAITPASKAFRFNARFFYAWESDMSGELGGSGELADLAFLDIEKALELPLVDVTQFMLEEIIRRKESGFTIPQLIPFSDIAKTGGINVINKACSVYIISGRTDHRYPARLLLLPSFAPLSK